MIWVVVVKSAALAYATWGAIRARFPLAWLLVVSVLATLVLPVALIFQPEGTLAGLVWRAPWAAPLAAAVVGAWLARRAFSELDREPAISPRVDPLETASYALLANALLDIALALLVGVGGVLATR